MKQLWGKYGRRGAAVILCGALAIGAALPLSGCRSASGGTIYMATNAQFQPFEYMDKNKIVGIDVDIANQIAKDMGKKLEIDNMEFNSVVTSVETGKDDMGVAGITDTAEREKQVAFSEPYYDASQVIVVKKGSPIAGQDDLKGKTISVQKGTTGDDLAKKLVGDKNVSRFNASAEAALAVSQGKVDAFIIDSFPAQMFVKQYSGLTIVGQPLESDKYCIAVKKGNTALLQQINKTIEKLQSSGELEKIVKKYS